MENEAVTFRRLRANDADELCSFYAGLSSESIRLFRPLGVETTVEVCRGICQENGPDREVKFDLCAWHEGVIVGWCFLWKLDSPEPVFGLSVADAWQGRGIGKSLAQRIMSVAARRGIKKVILTVVKENLNARRLYEKLSFSCYGEFVHNDDGLTYLRMSASP